MPICHMTDFEEKEKVHDCLLFFVWFCFVVIWPLIFSLKPSEVKSKVTEVKSSWGVLPYKRLMGMCRGMGSHFQDWIDYI